MQNRPLAIAGGLIALAVVFQVFGRYSYTYYHGVVIDRLDRLTGTSCRMPCLAPTPTPVPTVEPTPNLELEDQRAIELVRHRREVLAFVASALAADVREYSWRVLGRYTNDGKWGGPGMDPGLRGDLFRDYDPNKVETPGPPEVYPVRAVWYVKKLKDGSYSGYAWEAHLDTAEVFQVSGNAALEAKYYGKANH